MCIKNSSPLKIAGPMKVYKVFIVATCEDGSKKIHSPYRQYKTWRCGVNYSEPDVPMNKSLSRLLKEIYDTNTVGNEIHGGVFHSFIRKEDAEKLSEIIIGNEAYIKSLARVFMYADATSVDIAIGECTIPEDSEYVFEGDFEQGVEAKNHSVSVVKMRSVASSNLILDRVLEKEHELCEIKKQ